jgi:hypothetical protein
MAELDLPMDGFRLYVLESLEDNMVALMSQVTLGTH